ncbi:hypothetical protein SUDANB1_00835 [Streptomyces sp. enrichment culture]
MHPAGRKLALPLYHHGPTLSRMTEEAILSSGAERRSPEPGGAGGSTPETRAHDAAIW